MTTGRAIVNLPRKTMKDFSLAIACGTGSGCFVGTCSRYPNNWLQPVVGERTGMAGLDIFKAGLSVLIGFIFAQLIYFKAAKSLYLRQKVSIRYRNKFKKIKQLKKQNAFLFSFIIKIKNLG